MNARKCLPCVFLAALLVAACTETLSIVFTSDSNLEVSKEGGELSVSFISELPWQLTCNADWVTPDLMGGLGSASEQKIVFEVEPNMGMERRAYLTIYANSRDKRSFLIRQGGTDKPSGGEDGGNDDGGNESGGNEEGGNEGGGSDGGEVIPATEFSGVVVAVTAYGFLVKTDYGYKYAFDKDFRATVTVGDYVTVKGQETEYYGITEYTDYTFSILSHETYKQPVAKELSGEEFDSYSQLYGYVCFRGILSYENNSYLISVSGARCSGSLSLPVGIPSGYIGSEVVVTGYYFQKSLGVSQQFFMTEICLASEEKVFRFSGQVVAVTESGFLVHTSGDDSYRYVYDASVVRTVNVGDIVNVEGEFQWYYDIPEYYNYSVEVVNHSSVFYPVPTVLWGRYLETYHTLFGYVTFSGVLNHTNNKYTVTVDGTTMVGLFSLPVGVNQSLVGRYVDAEGYYFQTYGGLQIILTSLREGMPPMTCAAVKSVAEGTECRLRGTISDITSSNRYGNFYLSDGTDVIYIYGTNYFGMGGQGALDKLGLKEGDEIVVQGKKTVFSTTIELVDVDIIGYYKKSAI